MGADAFIEPIVVGTILSTGVLVNRHPPGVRERWHPPSGAASPAASEAGLLPPPRHAVEPPYRERSVFGRTVQSRNTARWRHTWLSRTLVRFPFVVEVWYWLLVYWVRCSGGGRRGGAGC